MWPKAFAQLIELAPHVSRLLPMADRFFQSKSAGDDPQRKAIDTLSNRVRDDLGQVTAAHSGFSQQLTEISSAIVTTANEARATRNSVDFLESRLLRVEKTQRTVQTLLLVSLFFLAAILVVLILLFVHGR